MRDQIIAEIKRLAALNGKPPGRQTFENETGIKQSQWYGVYWARWSDAVADAGLVPNERAVRTDRTFLLEKLADACRHFGQYPTKGELRIYKKRDPDFPWTSTLEKNFRDRDGAVEALRQWAASTEGQADILELLPAEAPTPMASGTRAKADGAVYLIKSGKHYKIGRSDELERRVKEIRIALPEAATLTHTITTDDPPGIEAYWHRRFADRRANGEWFALTPADVLAFKRRKFQ